MRSTFYKTSIALIFSAMLMGGWSLSAQSPHHLLVGNGGQFGPANYVTVASWELSTGNYNVFDSIPARSVQDLITSGPFAWLAADSFLVKYDLNNYQRLDSLLVPGIRKIATYDDLVIVTRGFGASSDYVQAFHQNDLSHAWTTSGLSGECEGIAIYQDTAFVAVPVAFGSNQNYLAAINAADGQLIRETVLNSNGLSAGRVLVNGDVIQVVLNSPFGGSQGAIVHFSPGTQLNTDFTLQHHVAGGTAVKSGLLYLFLDGALGSYDTGAQSVADPAIVPGSWAGAVMDTLNSEFFLTETDYFSYGILRRFDSTGQQIDSVVVGISPEALALDSYIATGAAEHTTRPSRLRCWPNPAQDRLHLTFDGPGRVEITLRDAMGRLCLPVRSISRFADLDLSNLAEGAYFLQARKGEVLETVKFIKLSK